LAEAPERAVGVERDPVTALLARANVPRAAILRGDAGQPPLSVEGAAVFVDPSRRDGARRAWRAEDYSPPWQRCLEVARRAARAAIKGPPSLPARAMPADAEVEYVQLGRSMREATLWLGDGAVPGLRRAVLLPPGTELDSRAPECDPEPIPPGAFLLDPESCVTTAGLVRHLGAITCGRLLDPHIAYLAAEAPSQTPFAASFEVLDRLDFQLNRLRSRLRENRWRPEEIRRRAFPVEPDELRKLLGRIEGDPVTLLCTTINGRRTVFVTRRVLSDASPSVPPGQRRPPPAEP
jgi:hypothetical protein